VSVRTSHRTSVTPVQAPAESPLDVLASGTERGPGTGGRLAGGAVLAAARVAAASLLGTGEGGPRQAADLVRLELHPDTVVVPRHLPPASGRAAVASVHVE